MSGPPLAAELKAILPSGVQAALETAVLPELTWMARVESPAGIDQRPNRAVICTVINLVASLVTLRSLYPFKSFVILRVSPSGYEMYLICVAVLAARARSPEIMSKPLASVSH